MARFVTHDVRPRRVRPRSFRETGIRTDYGESFGRRDVGRSSAASVAAVGWREFGGSMYYRNGTFRAIAGRFGKTLGSANSPISLGFSRVFWG